jgi:hypothetical protein
MKAYGRVDMQIDVLLTSALLEMNDQLHTLADILPRKLPVPIG